MNSQLTIFRIRKTKVSRRTGEIILAPGVGLRLANYFNADVVTTSLPKKKIPPGSLVLNYGRSVMPEWAGEFIHSGGRILNSPIAISKCIDKTDAFNLFQNNGIPTLTYTNQKEVAQSWLNNGQTVVVRALTKSKMGKGISIISPGEELPTAPLYTQYFHKTHEFRVHVFMGKVIDYVQKKKMGKVKRKLFNLDKVNMEVRNHKRGWVFARKDIFHSATIEQLGIDAIVATGLDFGAVDILANIEDDSLL